MIINRAILSIPPYISTSWKNIVSLHAETLSNFEKNLIITLTNESIIEVPGLDEKTLEQVFEQHAKFLDTESSHQKNLEPKTPTGFSLGIPIKMKEMDPTLGPFGSLMQHNPEESSSADLPDEMLTKISAIGKVIGLDKQLEHMPKAEPHCNCPYCQITRALSGEQKEKEIIEEIISEEDLSFKDWEIKMLDKDLYELTSPLDPNEKYQVFLGTPIGCTCGSKNCEHIKAVLSS